ncbi:MAG: methyltransferase domain-containing protein [Patescibacteria group bacterium]
MDIYEWILFTIGWIIIASAGVAGLSAAPWVPTRKKEMKLLLKNLDVKPGNKIYELGCGTGSIVIALAKANPQAQFFGYEISILPYLIAKFRSVRHKNVNICYKNLFTQSLSNADIVICFLLIKAYDRLAKKFAKELKPEAIVIAEGWPFENISPKTVLEADKTLPFFVYKGEDFKV